MKKKNSSFLSDWHYKGKPFQQSSIDIEDYVGFVYIITENSTQMKYVGKKLFFRQKILPVTKTRKRRKRVLVESDWKEYYGSNEKLKENFEKRDPSFIRSEYRREILHLCKTKGECSYMEAKEQFERDVLLNKDYYNGIINCRINAKHLNPKS